MPIVSSTYKKGPVEYMEVCPLDECLHGVGLKKHYIFEFPKHQGREEFIAEALTVVAEKEG